MSQYTENYHLEKPESNDDFENFRENYNSNMDIIDEHLGGGGSLTETIDVGTSSLAPNVTRWAKVGYFEKIDESSCTVLITGRADNGSNPWFSTIIDYSYATNTGGHIEQIHLEEEENIDFFIEDDGGYFYLWIFVAGLRMTDYGTWNITVLQSSDNQTIWHTDIQKDLSSTGHILGGVPLGGYVARAGNVVQSDWNESDLFDMAYIKNKPDYFKVVYAGGQGILNFVFDDGN